MRRQRWPTLRGGGRGLPIGHASDYTASDYTGAQPPRPCSRFAVSRLRTTLPPRRQKSEDAGERVRRVRLCGGGHLVGCDTDPGGATSHFYHGKGPGKSCSMRIEHNSWLWQDRTLWDHDAVIESLSRQDHTNMRFVTTVYGVKCWSVKFPRSDNPPKRGVLPRSRAEIVPR